jgi:hypothetical protein
VYSADFTVAPVTLRPKDLSGPFTDTDLTLNFTDDGRLSSINLTNTGQGTAIIKDVITVAKAALAPAAAPGAVYNPKQACATIAKSGAKSGSGGGPATLTLTYSGSFQYGKRSSQGDGTFSLGIQPVPGPNLANTLTIEPDAGSTTLYNDLLHNIPKLGFSVQIGSMPTKLASARWEGASSSTDVLITLNSVANAEISVIGPIGDLQNADLVWKGQVYVPLTGSGDLFSVPIPKAALFGTMKFSLSLSSYGSINKISYAHTGAVDAADAAGALGGAVAGALKKPTEAEQASAIQAHADLIYQQQRLVICKANPASCPAK